MKLPVNEQVLVVTGGSLGAARLNKAVAGIIDKLLKDYPGLQVIHQVGKGKLDDYMGYNHDRLQVLEFFSDMHVYTGAADIVVTRAGANTLAELGVQGKACIIVPNPDLTGGHQVTNAKILADLEAAVVVYEEDLPLGLDHAIHNLLDDANQARKIGKNLQKSTLGDASTTVAELLIKHGS